jgi:hypothetical protein
MMRDSGHLRGGNTATAIKSRKDLAQHNHLSAETWFFLNEGHMVTLVSQIQCRLHPRDATPDYQNIDIQVAHSHSLLTFSTELV